MVDTNNDLQSLIGLEVKTRPIRGETLVLTPVKFRYMPQLIKASSPFMADLKELKLNKAKGDFDAFKLAELIEKHQKDVAKSIAIMSGKYEVFRKQFENDADTDGKALKEATEWVMDCNSAEVGELFVKGVMVNVDFFMKTLLPDLLNHVQVVKSIISSVGMTNSNS